MADVVVTVMIDGKQAFVAGAAGVVNAADHATRALALARDHFASMAGPQPTPPAPKDNSL
jgi:hypothetical protein